MQTNPNPFSSRKVLGKGLWTYFKFPSETTEPQIIAFFADLGVAIDEKDVSLGDLDSHGNIGCMICFQRSLFTVLINLLIDHKTLNCAEVKALPWFRRDNAAGDWRP